MKRILLVALIATLALSLTTSAQVKLGIWRDGSSGNLAEAVAIVDASEPNEVETLAQAEFWDRGDNYVASMSGLILPPVTGDYVFSLYGDDHNGLFLSTDADPANIGVDSIASIDGWSNRGQWDHDGGLSNSEPILLEAGQAYAFRTVIREGGGGDGQGVGWTIPGGERELIPAQYLVQGPLPDVIDEIWREAEYPEILGANWRLLADPAASGLKAIGSDNGDGNDNNTAPGAEWVAAYDMDVVGGDYKILFRGAEAGSDSFWVRIVGATSQTLEDPDQPETGWVRFNGFDAPDGMAWDEVHSNDHDNETVIWTLPAGPVTLEIAKREDGVYLDGFIVTNVLTRDQDALPALIDPPPIAGAPVPDNGAIELDTTVLTALAWTPPAVAVSSKVYVSADDVIDADDLAGETDMATLDVVLEPGVTYSWRVDSIEADGTENTGEVWGFATLPIEAHFPSPADEAVVVAINETLSWTGGMGALVHNVFFSTDLALVEARDPSVQLGQWLSEATFDPGLLANETTYYWAVDEFLGISTNPGPVWSFTTIEGLPIVDSRLVAWYTFDKLNESDPDGLVIDWSGNSNTGTAMGDLANITVENDAVMGSVLSLPGGTNQFVDCGDVGISGNDPTTIAVWAKADNTNIPNWTLIFGFTGQEDGSGGNGSHFNIGSLGGPGGVGAHCWGWEETVFSDEDALDWHHYAMTYDGTTIAYYGDGVLMDTDEAKSNVQDLSARADRVHIGSRVTQGSSFPGDVDDCLGYNVVLGEAEILALALQIGDVTGPNDVVQGVPNDGDWPGGETPDLALDDDAGTKFLHFKGDELASGIQVEPAIGATVVTGLLLTTANDCAGRDPIAYEIYGSNEGIDGPYELIANGDVVDFAIEGEEWPRFTANATPIMFENAKAYTSYQVLFPAIRGPVGACVNSMQIAEVQLLGDVAKPVAAFAFGSRDIAVPTYNVPSLNYTVVLHVNNEPGLLQYDEAKGYGYDVIYPENSPYGGRNGFGVFGPFDDSRNNRGDFPDENVQEQVYDSFIGAKNFLDECNADTQGDISTPCDPPEGIIFRVDVPNGQYRFVAAVGEVDNTHTHRLVAEDGGSGPPENIGANHVVLVNNHDQAQYDIGQIEGDDPGDAVFARVGFDGKIPPVGDGIAPDPAFVNQDENGMPTDADPSSPILEVTQGYIRIHQLQGNSNDGPGGAKDVNGGDIVILELWKVD